ncbi:hypothetical protein CARUB_v10007980mg [Capsella rubella]|uniref:DUF4283 domain-containing protein n=1 Tax=Capsella rubella TaxID=81985 RepID=R0G717_9BRAS|nr:hypothetical protein CARUB_v10007980mg [Capsella rubella]
MMVIGERGRPPRDPPYGAGSYAAKLQGSEFGGIPTLESVMNAAFIKARVKLRFPDGEDGESVITVGEEVLEAMYGLWKNCMIVKVLRSYVLIAVQNRKLRELWRPEGAMTVMDLPRQFFLVLFEKEEEYMAALAGAWSAKFDPLKDDIVTAHVWVRLNNIPVFYYHESILLEIARGLGQLLRVDMTTLQFERARFAWVCVEVNLSKPLKGTKVVNGKIYLVAYEGLAKICSECGLYGHLIHSCPRRTSEMERVMVAANPVQETAAVVRQADGFKVVEWQGRRTGQPVNKMVFTASSSQSESRANLRDIPRCPNLEIWNRFGGLGEDTALEENREVSPMTRVNKENELRQPREDTGELVGEVKGLFPNSNMERGKGGNWNGLNLKKQGGGKALEANGPRQRKGLVFSPLKGNDGLSANGKRLRPGGDEETRQSTYS